MADATTPLAGRVSSDDYMSCLCAAEAIIKGTMVCRNATGYATDAIDSQEFILLGVAKGSVDNSAGAAGDEAVEIWTKGVFPFTIAATADQTYIGKLVYPTDNQTVSLAPNDYIGPIGRIVAFTSATSVDVELLPALHAANVGATEQTLKLALAAEAAPANGGCLTVRNTSGATRLITNFVVSVTTQSTGAATIDAGVASTVTTNDTLIDGASIATAATLDFVKNAGTNGANARLWVDDDYVTITASADSSGLVGSAYITFINA